ncbi:MAG: HD-GYP domain-containing protein, partial [Candidatus Eremiobacterota bacterium]
LSTQQRANLMAMRMSTESEIFRLSLNRATGQGGGVPSQIIQELASRHASHSIESILKKAYRDQEVGDLDEESAVNSLGLVLKLGGEFTYAHSARVLEYAMELADELGITDEETRKKVKYGALLKDIGEIGLLLDRESEEKLSKMGDFLGSQDMIRAGLLHDIGKVRIPPEILYKPGRLTEEEYAIMKMHPIYGEQIVYPIASLRHLCPTIRGHHERWDGKGYPDGLRGEEIPVSARIIAVADVFDALAAARPYKPGMDIEKVRSILLEGRGTHFDPDLIDAFMRVMDRRYPELARKRSKKARQEA